MTFDDFCKDLKKTLKALGQAEGKQLFIQENSVAKLNFGEQLAYTIQVAGKPQTGRLFYLEDYYIQEKMGKSLAHMAKEILAQCQEPLQPEHAYISQAANLNWENAKDKIVLITYGYERNKGVLNQYPFLREKDFVATYHILLEDAKESFSKIPIHNELFKKWGIHLSTLHRTAVENTLRLMPPLLQGMEEALRSINMTDMEEIPANESPFIKLDILTNQNRVYGANALFCPGVLKQIGEKYPEGFYILPSSIHEVIILPKASGFERKQLEKQVRSINREIVSPEDFLSDTVHAYDPSRNRLFAGEEIDHLLENPPSLTKHLPKDKKR